MKFELLTVTMAYVTEMDRSEIIVRMEIGPESGHSKIDNVEPGSTKG